MFQFTEALNKHFDYNKKRSYAILQGVEHVTERD